MTYYRTRRPRVQWNDAQGPNAKELHPFPLVVDITTDEEMEIRVPYLQVGSLWMCGELLKEDYRFDETSFRHHEHLYLILPISRYQGSSRRVPKTYERGTMAVYMGECRVEEMPPSPGTLRRVMRHKFLVDGTIYLASHMRHFIPVFD